MKQKSPIKKNSKSPIEKPASQDESNNKSEHGSDKQTKLKDADYDNQGRPNSPL